MAGHFCGKVVVVLGSHGAIGLTSAKAFANEGAQVVIMGDDSDILRTASQSISGDVIAVRLDMSDLQQSSTSFAELERIVGRIDVLFISAGVLAVLPVESISETAWDRSYDNNLKGAFFSVQAALPLMSRGSNIILTSSVAAYKGEAGALLYATTKAAVRALGRSLAGELVGRGIRVNVISPGIVCVQNPHDASHSSVLSGDASTIAQRLIERIPMKRAGSPEEVAAAVLFLASDGASYITGIDLPIDGGVTGL